MRHQQSTLQFPPLSLCLPVASLIWTPNLKFPILDCATCRRPSSHQYCDPETPSAYCRSPVPWRRSCSGRAVGKSSVWATSLSWMRTSALAREGFFAGPAASRVSAFKEALAEHGSRAIFCSRGGYGANYLLDGLSVALASPKVLLGHSDITSLQICLWQKFGWVTLHGPMVASSLVHGAGAPKGYDRDSLLHALAETQNGWVLDLKGGAAQFPDRWRAFCWGAA